MTATEQIIFWMEQARMAERWLEQGRGDRETNLEIIALAEARLRELRRNPAK